MTSFTNGFYALCQGPSHYRRLWFFRITQPLWCIAWFIFSIIGAGPFDGWAKFGVLSHCHLGFSIFLGVVQNLLYMVTCALGIYTVVALERAYGENPFNEEAVGGPAQQRKQEGTEEDVGFGAGLQGFGKRVFGKGHA